jgi:hypothetical protein
MKAKTKFLAICIGVAALGAHAIPALADSVSQPGFSMGAPLGANPPPGLYFANFVNWGAAKESVGDHSVGNGVEIPAVIWSTGYNVLGASLAMSAAWGAVEVGIPNTSYAIDAFNPIVNPVSLSWNLGSGFFVSFQEAMYLPVHTKVSAPGASIEQRVNVSYLANDWVISANNNVGITTESSYTGKVPDYYNIDGTLAHRFGAWELGAVGYGSFDIETTSLNSALGRGRAVGVGGILGYAFSNGIGLNFILSHQVVSIGTTEYGKEDTRVWSTLVIPIWTPTASAAKPLVAKY